MKHTPKDAALIAAAPDLFNVLCEILKSTKEWPLKNGRPYCGGSFLSEKLFDQANKAIAKAKGE